MTKESIFSRSRFEYEGDHLYYLEDSKVHLLENHTAIVIHGSRGTGKTTLLNALNWKEQLSNRSLQESVGPKKYTNQYLGVYLKLPKINIGSFSKWQSSDEIIYAQLFALYLDLVWLEQLAIAIGTLASTNEIVISAKEERSICNEIHKYCRSLFESLGCSRNVFGLMDLRDIFKTLRESLEQAATYGEDAIDLHRNLNLVGQVGEYGREISKILHGLWSSKGNSDYAFKICMDECECLDDFQIKVLSTLVRIGSSPVFFVLSFISFPRDFYSTLVPNLSLGKPYVSSISLYEMKYSEFQKFAECVFLVRLRA